MNITNVTLEVKLNSEEWDGPDKAGYIVDTVEKVLRDMLRSAPSGESNLSIYITMESPT